LSNRDQVVGRRALAPRDHGRKVAEDLVAGAPRGIDVGIVQIVVHPAQVHRHLGERHAHHVGEDHRRNALRDVGHEVAAAVRRDLLDQIAAHRIDLRPHALDRAGRHVGRQHLTILGVFGRVRLGRDQPHREARRAEHGRHVAEIRRIDHDLVDIRLPRHHPMAAERRAPEDRRVVRRHFHHPRPGALAQTGIADVVEGPNELLRNMVGNSDDPAVCGRTPLCGVDHLYPADLVN
jgi:hypothetical protein